MAKATAKIATGVITGIDVNETGYGFTAPAVTLAGGNPTAGSEAHALASGTVDNLKLTDGGNGYQSQPLVNISKPDLADGVQATASAAMDANGVVTGVDIANAGSGYTTAPTVTVTDASKTAPTQAATVEATIGVTRIDVTDGGAGYDSAPTVTIADTVGTADKGASATARVAVKGSVTDIVVTTPERATSPRGSRSSSTPFPAREKPTPTTWASTSQLQCPTPPPTPAPTTTRSRLCSIG
ncbi:hypothetical protein NHF46_13230 [Arthrobacter alpinus]|nr:hypothetical protein [Arthrobacter alpinus]